MALFRRRPRGYLVSIHLAARLQPMHRGDIFEDPLDRFLGHRHPGAHVADGGTTVSAEERITSCDLAVFVPASVDPDRVLDDVVQQVERLGAPRGSSVTVGDRIVEVGGHDEVVLRFDDIVDRDGIGDDHVPHSREIDTVVRDVTTAHGDLVGYVSWQIHRDGSELYLYGPSGAALREALAGAQVLTGTARVLPAD